MSKRNGLLLTLIVALVCISVCGVAFAEGGNQQSQPMAATDNEQTYYYDQLDPMAQQLYKAMQTLLDNGGMKSGVGSIDLVEKGLLTSDQIKNYVNGDSSLAKSFQNARDAFEKDHYYVFYVDFTKLTLRVGKVENNYLAYINNGANANYFAAGFTSVDQVNDAIAKSIASRDALLTAVKAEITPNTDNIDKVATILHDKLIEALEYTYPDDTHQFVAGVYALASGGHANCQGYATLYKWVLDQLNIENILVAGMATNSRNVSEQHMWNYIKIKGAWFAVDVTWDDPIGASKSATTSKEDYLLKGSEEFNMNHFAMGIFSPQGMDFKYPSLNDVSYDIFTMPSLDSSKSEIMINTEKYIDKAGDQFTWLTVSYMGKSLDQLAKEGLYIAYKMHWAETPTEVQPWAPIDNFGKLSRNTPYFQFELYRNSTIQFCVTSIKLSNTEMFYKIDLAAKGNHQYIREPFAVPYYSGYVTPPFIRSSEPFLGRCILPQKTTFKVEYDEELVPVDPSLPLSMTVTSSQGLPSKAENIKVSYGEYKLPTGYLRKSTVVEFDFTPDGTYQAYINKYAVHLDNYIGAKSKKPANPVPISVTFEMKVPCPTFVGKGTADAFVIALPTLVVNDNLDIFDYKDGQSAAINPMDIRLVASIPNDKEKSEMLESSGEKDILSSSVYDLSLSCRDHLVKLKSESNYNITIGLPYPEGFNYNDNKNVQFKAYHYRKQPDGTFVAKELVCRITERGLEIIATDFSPFSIVAVPKVAGSESTHKFVGIDAMTNGGDIMQTVGGKSISAVGLHPLTSGQNKTFTFLPNAGYSLDKVMLGGKAIAIQNNTITFDYATMLTDSTMQVYYIANTVKEIEDIKGFENIIPITNTSGEKLELNLNDAKFTAKTVKHDGKEHSIVVTGLPADGYKVVYINNTATKVGTYTATAVIYKLTSDGVSVDETYKTMTLTAQLIITAKSSANSFLTIGLPIIITLLVVIAGAVVIVLLCKRQK